MAQLPLPLRFDKRFSFSNYLSQHARYIKQQLTGLFDESGETMIGLWGAEDSGKTHLLNACAHYAGLSQVSLHLFDAAHLAEADSEGFVDFMPGSVIGIDNLDILAGHPAWEKQFYQLINRVKAGELRFIYSLSQAPRDTSFKLPDLKSRLMWGLLIALEPADDHHLELILKQRADMLGLRLSDEVVHYLMSHYSRKLSDQMEMLYQLDHASMSRQRKITIPLIREIC